MGNKTIKAICTALIVIGSTGWAIPLWLCIEQIITWGQLEVSPRIYEQKVTSNSFPFLSSASQMLSIAMAWLAIVCASWSSYLSWYFVWRRKPEKEAP